MKSTHDTDYVAAMGDYSLQDANFLGTQAKLPNQVMREYSIHSCYFLGITSRAMFSIERPITGVYTLAR